jgi:hypothetical protein
MGTVPIPLRFFDVRGKKPAAFPEKHGDFQLGATHVEDRRGFGGASTRFPDAFHGFQSSGRQISRKSATA